MKNRFLILIILLLLSIVAFSCVPNIDLIITYTADSDYPSEGDEITITLKSATIEVIDLYLFDKNGTKVEVIEEGLTLSLNEDNTTTWTVSSGLSGEYRFRGYIAGEDTSNSIEYSQSAPINIGIAKCIDGTNTTINIYNWSTNSLDEDVAVCTVKQSTHANLMMPEDELTLLFMSDINELATEFDTEVYPKVTSKFGPLSSDIDSNNRVNIVMYDIKYYVEGVEIRGFVNSDDMDDTFDGTIGNSNDGEYFYMDVTNFNTNKDIIKSTLAHEFQHVVNQSIQISIGNAGPMEVWVDEGLSMAAEHYVYGSSILEDRINNFNTSENIRNANSTLLVWEPAKAISNYALSYVFVQWLAKTYTDSIYANIINQVGNGNASSVVSAAGSSNFEVLLKGWGIDNLINPTYGGRLTKALTVQTPTQQITQLKPGGVAYDPDNDCDGGCSTAGGGSNIRMLSIDDSGTIYDVNDPLGTKSMVLNVNPSENGSAENIGTWEAFGAEPPLLRITQFDENMRRRMRSINPRVPKNK
jgi:hypothetical protein